MKDSYKINLLGEELILLPEKAIYFKKGNILLLADLHLGKTGHFRNAGIPVPPRLAFADLETIDILLNEKFPDTERLIILGDLFHSEMNIDWKIFERWRSGYLNLNIQLIKGNHDVFSNSIYEEMGVEVFDIFIVNNFILVHKYNDEETPEGLYKICGHIHPAVRIRGKARQALTLPCFYFGSTFGVLPSFGSFTGRYIIQPSENDSIFVIVDYNCEKKIIKI